MNVLLTMVIFVSWLGGAVFHNHGPTSSPCKVCQALQSNQADLPVEYTTARPAPTSERLAGAAPPQSIVALLLVPEGRAPPSA